MVGEVLAHRRALEQHLDFAHLQVFGGAHPGEHEKLRRVVGAAAQDHLALGAQLVDLAELLRLDADRARALEEHPLHVHVRLDIEIRPLHRGVQVCDGGARTLPAAVRHLVDPHAVLCLAVEVLVESQTGLLARVDEGAGDAVARAVLAHRQRPADAVPARGAALVVLGLQEVGEEVRPRPAGDAPAVVVERVAADVDHRVDR